MEPPVAIARGADATRALSFCAESTLSAERALNRALGGIGPPARPLSQGLVPAEGLLPGRRIQALELVAAVQHVSLEERRRPIAETDVNAGERREDQQMPDSGSRDLMVPDGPHPPTPGVKVDLDDALVCIEYKVLHDRSPAINAALASDIPVEAPR
jgi:hypothetical protein